MKCIKRKIGLACFCISLMFGIYTLKYEDAPRSAISSDITITNTGSSAITM